MVWLAASQGQSHGLSVDQGSVGESNTAFQAWLSASPVLPMPACHSRASLAISWTPRLNCPTSHLLREGKRFFLITTFFFSLEHSTISRGLENRILFKITALTEPTSLPSDQAIGSAGLVSDAAPGGARSGSCLLLPREPGIHHC